MNLNVENTEEKPLLVSDYEDESYFSPLIPCFSVVIQLSDIVYCTWFCIFVYVHDIIYVQDTSSVTAIVRDG